jgi:hypothetical protein
MLTQEPFEKCHADSTVPPKLVVVVDTEEEFDWSQPFSREKTSVKAMRHIQRVQDIFDEFHIKPVYVIDYPVASQPDGFLPLREIYQSDRCLIGAHLHPWVNPPYVETITRRNSFPGNLPPSLEATKLQILSDCIGENFGEAPVIYKAGRYGIGPNTATILEDQGFKADLSVCPYMDYSKEGGPDFSHFSPCPYLFGTNRKLVEIPLTVGFSGYLRNWGCSLHGIGSRGWMSKLHAIGMMARMGIVDKIWLSPEGFTSGEHMSLVRDMYADGLRIFSFAFHSPSVEPGHTPYVTTPRESEEFFTRIRKFFDFFMGKMSGQPVTPLEVPSSIAHA